MIANTKVLYKSIGSVHSKALKVDVVFNRHGLNHLIFDGAGKRRLPQSLRQRLHLFQHAERVVKEGLLAKPVEERTVKINGTPRLAKFYELAHCNASGDDVTVVIRQFEVGSPHYFSIRKTRIRRTTKKAS